MQVSTETEITIDRPRAEVFAELIRDEAFVVYCKKLGPFAGVAEARTRGELRAGARRSIEMTDGMKLEETIAEHDPPRCHAYGWENPPKPLGLLLRRADSVWTFEESGDATKVIWHYTFTLRTWLLWPFGKLIVIGFRRWMKAGLERGKAALESKPAG